MGEDKDSAAAIQKPIIYLGEDTGYLDELQKNYRKYYPHMTTPFVALKESNPDKIQSLYHRILDANPTMVIIDLALNGKEYLQLARLIVRINATKKVPTIAIFDNLSSKLLPASVISGVKFNFLKTSDYYTICRAMIYSLTPNDIGEAELATATLNDKVEAFECCQIGFLNDEFVHIELNKILKKDEMIQLRTILQKEKVIPSMEMDLISTAEESLFYNFDYSARLKFRFVDKIIPQDHPQDKLNELELDRSSTILGAQNRLKKWLKENDDQLPEKFLRALIIERELSFLSREERTDSYDFLIRLHPYMLESLKEIQKLLPHIIVYQFDLFEDETDKPMFANDFESLKDLIKSIKRFDDYNPYIIVFNSYLGSNTLQTKLNYPNVIAYDKPLEVEAIIKIVEVLKQKMKNKFEKISGLNPVFIKKDRKGAMAEIKFHMKLIKINESEVMFETDYPLNEGEVIHLDSPINMYVTLTHEKFERPDIRKGLISGADELGLSTLRRYINSVFFREKEAQREEEKLAFEKQKEDALRQKKQAEEDAIKAKEEAAKKKKAEEDSNDKGPEKKDDSQNDDD